MTAPSAVATERREQSRTGTACSNRPGRRRGDIRHRRTGASTSDPFTGGPADKLASATVVGPSLTSADAYATAAFVLGEQALAWIRGVEGYEALLVTGDRTVLTSDHWPADAVATPATRT